MPQKKYKFNPQTLTYEVIVTPFRLRFYRFLRKLLIAFILASVVNFLFSWFFYTPKMAAINRENDELLIKYSILQDKIDAATDRIGEIKHRDHNVYRMLFAADTLEVDGLYGPYPDAKYAYFADDSYGDLIYNTWAGMDDLARMIYLESLSMDELQDMSLDKEKMSSSIPAIWPIDKRRLKGSIGAFGGRNHPLLGRYQMHTGIDLGADRGVPVYATGDGVVVADPDRGTGYGIQVLINHGFGYKTRYAHLNKSYVTPGQHVRRGEVIGEVGSTGRSSGPHLHYEVIYMNQHVNPINYFRNDMDEAEFERIIEMAKATTYELDD
ncbi:MAG: M23 family metallopeptidase [Rikenellaceae bacterium]|nr:M23 family metallopeptidase [Rikenellaceae bacterium]